MGAHPLTIALSGKGAFSFLRRGTSIVGRYGLTADRLARELQTFTDLARRYNARPTFPITAVVLERHPRLVQQLHAEGAEFCIHGYYHADHSALPLTVQRRQLETALQAFAKAHIPVRGFRGPYLRWNADTLTVLRDLGLDYDASQGLFWDVLPDAGPLAYRRVLDFYRAAPAAAQLALPTLRDGLVGLPYSLPDDEALIERLRLDSPTAQSALWLAILRRSLALGELFALGLHPERTSLLLQPLRAVLEAAVSQSPPVWLARLDEIAVWWRERAAVQIQLETREQGQFRVTVRGPRAATMLLRHAATPAPAMRWAEGYYQVMATSFEVNASAPPVVGLAPDVAPGVAEFLRDHGYLVTASTTGADCAYWVHSLPSFSSPDQRPLLDKIEASHEPLLKLSRWPNGARSALALTGDIDALTLWDYGLRFVER
jgi:hypothetical protein